MVTSAQSSNVSSINQSPGKTNGFFLKGISFIVELVIGIVVY